tara:strand:- start:7040 stop:7240 length:201 start_codon:yes stop_codon:yes gene_type:complete
MAYVEETTKIMERQEEIKQLLKHLLGEVEKVIDKNQYTDDLDKIIESCKGVLENSELIKKYMEELK